MSKKTLTLIMNDKSARTPKSVDEVTAQLAGVPIPMFEFWEV